MRGLLLSGSSRQSGSVLSDERGMDMVVLPEPRHCGEMMVMVLAGVGVSVVMEPGTFRRTTRLPWGASDPTRSCT
ncbi:hypothetical protein D9M69_685320 [compost metagenome]